MYLLAIDRRGSHIAIVECGPRSEFCCSMRKRRSRVYGVFIYIPGMYLMYVISTCSRIVYLPYIRYDS